MSKVFGRLVYHQPVMILKWRNLLPNLQSAYWHNQSTKSAIFNIVSDILLSADCGDVTLLGLLDMSVAYDTVDHDILVDCPWKAFGVICLQSHGLEVLSMNKCKWLSLPAMSTQSQLLTVVFHKKRFGTYTVPPVYGQSANDLSQAQS